MHVRIHSECQKIREAFDRCDTLPHDDLLRSHWAKYLSIVTAGLLEYSIKILLSEYVHRCANSHVASYADSQLSTFSNPNTSKIETLLTQFNPTWARRLAAFWEEERKAAIDSVINIRHHAAHGRHFGTTIAQMNTYHRRIIEVINFLDEMVLGDT
jgi:hypothetical protein